MYNCDMCLEINFFCFIEDDTTASAPTLNVSQTEEEQSSNRIPNKDISDEHASLNLGVENESRASASDHQLQQHHNGSRMATHFGHIHNSRWPYHHPQNHLPFSPQTHSSSKTSNQQRGSVLSASIPTPQVGFSF